MTLYNNPAILYSIPEVKRVTLTSKTDENPKHENRKVDFGMKKLLALIMAVMMLLSVAGMATAEVPEGRIEVKIWDYFETDAQREMIQWIMDGFNESQDVYYATHEYVPFANYKTQLQLGEPQDIA